MKRRRKASQTTGGLAMIVIIICVLFGVITVNRIQLEKQSQVHAVTQENLKIKIEEAEKTKEELETKETYMQTKKYIEDVAKAKLGLVYPDEKFFKAK